MSQVSGFKSSSLDLKLISLVKDNPVLYDHNDPSYMDFNVREVIWHKIGDEMKRPASECKDRWMDIRDINRRILSKTLRNPDAGCRMYKYSNVLEFMRPFYRDDMIKNAEFGEVEESGSDRSKSDENDADKYLSIDEDSNDSNPLKPKKSSLKNRKVPMKRKKQTEKNEIDSSSSDSTSTTKEMMLADDFNPSDKVESFLRDIGATLKTLSPYHLNVAKTKIFAIVQELELQQIVSKRAKTIDE